MSAIKIVFESVEIKKVNEPIGNKVNVSRGLLDKVVNKVYFEIQRMNKKLNKILISLLTLVFISVQGMFPLAVSAEEVPSPTPTETPAVPTPPAQPEATITPPESPTPPAQPEATITPPATPTPPAAPTLDEATSITPPPVPQSDDEAEEENQSTSGGSTNPAPASGDSQGGNILPQSSSASVDSTGGNSEEGVSGSATITTGDANNTGNISTTANTNISVTPSSTTGDAGVKVANTGNGSDTNNSASAGISDTTNNLQTNQAKVGSNLEQNTVTGDNSASKNTGGNQTINSGDANTTGTIITAVNTNVDGLTVYEFNVNEDYIGNYVLDFSEANCISGCAGGDLSVANTGNGANSENNAGADLTTADNSFQTNDADIENNMDLVSDSGDNKANFNTGGDSTITTGDANVSGNVVNMVNNNVAGEVIYAVVNVFGDLVGDIILPDSALLGCCASDASVGNTGNGADSVNDASLDQSTTANTTQFNNADIQNNLILEAETGENDANKNTDGSTSVTTGDANILAQIMNVANLNIVDGNFWLVLVNEAGKWIGRIIGADGQNYAGSEDLEFIVGENGEITVVNSGNGAGSDNTATATQSSDTNTSQTNNATIVNNVNLSANTGGNNTNYNTGGNNSIATGDANVVANIVNFVNNNIVGAGRLFVTVINVFGSWIGNFVSPGQTSENNGSSPENSGIGGASENNSNNNSSGGTPNTNSNTAVVVTNVNPANNSRGGTNINSGISKLTSVLASASFSDESVAVNNDSDASNNNETAGKKVVKINLAYLLFVIPAVLLFSVARKKRLFSKVFAARKQNA